jgi:hypothetical protein
VIIAAVLTVHVVILGPLLVVDRLLARLQAAFLVTAASVCRR